MPSTGSRNGPRTLRPVSSWSASRAARINPSACSSSTANTPAGRRSRIRTRAKATDRSGREFDVTFQSSVFQHRVHFDLPGLRHEASDNFLELYPDEAKTARVSLARPLTPKALLARLQTGSLVDTYV
jgi:hypothetical protein